MSEHSFVFFFVNFVQAQATPIDRSLIPEYFPPGEKAANLERSEPTAALGDSNDASN